MASHHHHRQQQHCHTAHSTTSCYCCNCCTPSQQSPPPSDPLLQALASYLFLQQQPPQSPHSQSPYLKPQTSHRLPHQAEIHHQYRPKQNRFQQDLNHQHHQTNIILSSLVNRIDALEFALHNLSSPSFSSYHRPSQSLRDLAARTIQTHFRAFLVRRSKTLRHLKHLALIKSTFNTLKSSISNQTHLVPQILSHKAMDLLLKLDSIQDGDPMIRNGKRSISRDLVRFLEFIEGISVKRHELSTKAMKNARFVQSTNKSRVFTTNCRSLGRDQSEIIKNLRERVENISGFSRVSGNDDEDVELEVFPHVSDDDENTRVSVYKKSGISQIRNGGLVKRHGVQSRVKKSVSFADNGKAFRVYSSNLEPVLSGDDDNTSFDGVNPDDDEGDVKNICRQVEDIGRFSRVTDDDEEAHMENYGSSQSSDGEKTPRRKMTSEDHYGINEHYEDQSGEAHMENGGSSQSSDEDKNPGRNMRNEGINGHYEDQNGNFIFSPPLPVKMESREDLMKRRKAVQGLQKGSQ